MDVNEVVAVENHPPPKVTIQQLVVGHEAIAEDAPAVANVVVKIANRSTADGRYVGSNEVNWGKFIKATYSLAKTHAYGYMGYTQPVAEAQLGTARFPRTAHVRLTLTPISLIHMGTNEISNVTTLSTDNRQINQVDNNATVNALFRSLNHKYLEQRVGQHENSQGGLRVNPVFQEINVGYFFQFVGARPPRATVRMNYARRHSVEYPIVRGGTRVTRQARNNQSIVIGEPVPRSARELAREQTHGRRVHQREDIMQVNTRAPLTAHELRTRIGACTYDDIVKNIDSRIYLRGSLGDIFSYSKGVIGVPETEEQLCFPMAFLRSELRTWEFKTHANGQKSSEVTRIQEGDTIIIPVITPAGETLDSFLTNTSFFTRLTDTTGEIKVFDNTKKEIQGGVPGQRLYVNEYTDTSDTTLKIWMWCALELHLYVEHVWGGEIDYTNMEACLAAYSYVFITNISVFMAEERGKRVLVQKVHNGGRLTSERHIGLMLKGEHVHAISSMRHYHRSEIHSKAGGRSVYCDRCATIAYNRQLTHQSKCSKDDSWDVLPELSELHLGDLKNTSERRLITHPKRKDGSNPLMEMCYTCKQAVPECPCTSSNPKYVQYVTCITCQKDVPRNHYNAHECFMPKKKELEPLDDNSIFVLDLESLQDREDVTGKHVHECILICFRAVYDNRRWSFKTIDEFIKFLVGNKEMHGATILAHNGGGYDYQFLIQYFESNGIMHSVIPRPCTMHKYLMVKMKMTGKSTEIRFLDFMMMMTASLRDVGRAFKLDVCKGDFPHRFSTSANRNYCGPIPPIDSEEDYYGLKQSRSDKEYADSRKYWGDQATKYCSCTSNLTCTCTLPKWDFQKELEAYCWIDVDVLAEACKKYRDQTMAFVCPEEYGWEAKGVDPFNYMTQSQIALALYTQGKVTRDLSITHERKRAKFRPGQIRWLEHIQANNSQYAIQHAGNSYKEHYSVDDLCYVDGYCPNTRTVFMYYDCDYDACPICHSDEICSDQVHPTRQVKWMTIHQLVQRRLNGLKKNNVYSSVVVHWSHDDKNIVIPDEDPRRWALMGLRDIFYGGRTEVFAAYATPPEGMKIEYADVCSLYPYVCAHKDLPIGYPEVIYDPLKMDFRRFYVDHPDPYFGFVRARILPNDQDLIGVLPQRTDGKLKYTLHEKEGCWSIEFIKLALERGYKILKVYEIWHWSSNKRSNTAMRGYMQFFLRMKQAAEGWGKMGQDLYTSEQLLDENRTTEMEDKIMDYIEEKNGGMARPSREMIAVNPVLRQLAKIFLNCLWGKLCQKPPTEEEFFLYGYQQYIGFMTNPAIDRSSLKFRHVNGGVYKVRYKKIAAVYSAEGSFINVPMAATVTAHAQVLLMRQMFVVGPERVLYCDTDSIIYLKEKDGVQYCASGLGNWADEYPGKVIRKFLALAPKCYVLDIEDDAMLFKAKGVRLTTENRQRTSLENLQALVQGAFIPGTGEAALSADTMLINSNSTNSALKYGTVCTTYGKKDLRVVYSKRVLNVNTQIQVESLDQMDLVRLLPEGYKGDLGHTLKRTAEVLEDYCPTDVDDSDTETEEEPLKYPRVD